MASLRHVVVAAVTALGPAGVSALFTNGSVVAPCDSPIYCHGDILQEIELAQPFADSKTFVDMPATKSLQEIQDAFAKLAKPVKNDSALHDFLNQHFGQAGGELSPVPRDQLKTDPLFLNNLSDTVIREFVGKVIDIWPDLTRSYSPSTGNCSAADGGQCPSSFIPINHTFVVAGGRFREPYYWDSYWILEGLLRTRGAFTEIARNTIDNFLDLVERFGLIPNGARVYYLNRSQPPMLTQMVRIYMEHTGDAAILDRALPLLVREHDFWARNRSVDIAGPCGKNYTLSRYAVENTQPRPESFREDYQMANNASYFSATSGSVFNETAPLDDAQRAELYANLATAAESGWDFSSRWLSRPQDSARDDYFPLRSLNGRNVVPVCLNSILYANERAIAGFFRQRGNGSAAGDWDGRAARRSEAMHALLWNETLFTYFDYNLTSRAHDVYVPVDDDAAAEDKTGAPEGYQVLFHAAQLFPFWLGAAREDLKKPSAVKRAYARVARYLDARAGGIPATNYQTAQQWDQPNVWPPLMHPLMQGLLNTAPGPEPSGPAPAGGADEQQAHRDVHALAVKLAQRYLDSTFCTWYATGGFTSETPKLPGLTDADTGIMFEKYADNSTNVAGGGGEYEVVEGFGWTNGVLIWAADTFSAELKRPDCGDIKAAKSGADGGGGNARRSSSAVHLDARDARRIKMFGSRPNKR
ncbi:trehalase domain-containing protein [Hirsutella rhossiliensis]|uniref:Trehalase n=1 Tax=Hirsutella rhossiliensis TaxID=111463 RepID=A0A9P8SI40_9HYPO|nr:trehalase domain-containing protein [Hirsutella rhossiliensis]KAH0963481.1 trehalase domain-containing protein [Hirsutella rhossiliensis]